MPSEAKFQFLMTITSHATAYLGPILLKQGQSPKALAKLITDYSVDCYERVAAECGIVNVKPQNALRKIVS